MQAIPCAWLPKVTKFTPPNWAVVLSTIAILLLTFTYCNCSLIYNHAGGSTWIQDLLMERIFIMQQPKEHSFDSEKFISWLGRFASVIAILMYVSYIAQIVNNLHGQYGAPLQPFVAGVNCSLWSIYAYFKKDRDWPVFWANFPGVFFSFATFITCFHF